MKRKIIIGIIGILAVITVVLVVNFYPMLLMAPLETGTVENTPIRAVRNNINNIFLLEHEEGYIVIDAGTNIGRVEESLADISVSAADVTDLFLTHTDSDHIGAVTLFEHANIYLGEDEKEMISGEVKRNLVQYNKLPETVKTEDVIWLADEEEVAVGKMRIKCFNTPGHTKGSVSYLVNGEYLFTGDALRLKDDNVFVHPFTMDKTEAQQSIEKIMAIKEGSNLIFTAHYGYIESDSLGN